MDTGNFGAVKDISLDEKIDEDTNRITTKTDDNGVPGAKGEIRDQRVNGVQPTVVKTFTANFGAVKDISLVEKIDEDTNRITTKTDANGVPGAKSEYLEQKDRKSVE